MLIRRTRGEHRREHIADLFVALALQTENRVELEITPLRAPRVHELDHALVGDAQLVVHSKQILDGGIFGDDVAKGALREPRMLLARSRELSEGILRELR